jgi:hypothetical protein
MKRLPSRVKTAVLPRTITMGRFIFMALAFLLFVSFFSAVTFIGHHAR